MEKVKRLYEFQCSKGEKWYKEEQEIVCPIKKDCKEDIKTIDYSVVEIIHAADFKEEGGEEPYSSKSMDLCRNFINGG